MKPSINFLLFVALLLFLVSCATPRVYPPPTDIPGEEQRARAVLLAFLQNLQEGKYEQAAQGYGGSYDFMIDHNPGLDPDDRAALLEHACTVNGAQCLQVKSAVLDRKISTTEFVFRVEFSNQDGTLFVRGPCCGGNETDFPPESEFDFMVKKVGEDSFAVMDMPPYSP